MRVRGGEAGIVRSLRVLMVAAFLVGGAAASAGAASDAVSRGPHIRVHPASAMVNTSIELQGSHFAPDQQITIEECSAKRWIAPQNPCNTTNLVSVETNSKGAFHHSLLALLCPLNPPPPGVSRTCYVGEPAGKDVDVLTLLGAATITVTGP
jgi:hypothetical protein